MGGEAWFCVCAFFLPIGSPFPWIPGNAPNHRTGARCGAVCQFVRWPTLLRSVPERRNNSSNGARGAIPEPIPRFLSFMSDSSLLGFWAIRTDGPPAESPTWSRPALPGEPQPPQKGPQRRPILPGELQPIRHRQTAAGHRVAWDEPGENF
jgi:hypothetical protein